ncbi:MAG: D-alanyl-D-alanine carboxypeptidase [Thermoleophilaceae bacterium]|nr:D-alanyl-D-alanine carboxypeptidase [Thermoleophilaceae bacterium]
MTSRARIAAIAALAAAALPCAAAAAQPPPEVQAPAAIVVDARDGHVLFARAAEEHRAIASTTKLMTALLTLERARPDEVFTAPDYDAAPAESRIDLAAGERMTVADLLKALLLESANDAAVTLARGVSGSTQRFVGAMNRRAEELGLEDTSYANPVGLDDPGAYSSAHDLATLAAVLMRRPRFARIVDLPEARLESGNRTRVVENRNLLIARYPFVTGVKTGHTLRAGYVLIGAAGNARTGRVLSVVLGDPSEAARDADTLALLRWGLSRFERVRPLRPARTVAEVDIAHRSEDAELVPARPVALTVRRGQRVRVRASAPDELDGPIEAGTRVGTASVLVDGRAVRRVALVPRADVPGAGTVRVVVSTLGVPLTLALVAAILLIAAMTVLRIRVRLRLVR